MGRPRGLAIVSGLALALCSGSGAWAETLRVFGAASLTDAFREVVTAFEKQHPGDAVELNFTGSQVLRTQVEQGASADVFASADLAHADALARQGLLNPWRVFARNRIVVVVPGGESKVKRLDDLARPGTKIVVAGATVPAGRYTAEVLDKLGAARAFGESFRSRVQANVVSHETNVRVVLSKVALGEADAGFVYATDAATSGEVRIVDVPDSFNVIAEYPIGVLTKSAAPGRANTFVDFVLGAEGQAILRKYGFGQ
jgi:molybdate transport system substrate-binding protein